jgi:hypothetical protein
LAGRADGLGDTHFVVDEDLDARPFLTRGEGRRGGSRQSRERFKSGLPRPRTGTR